MKKNKPVGSIVKSFISTFASVFLTVMAIGFIIYVIWQRISIDNLNRECDALKAEKKELKNRILHVAKEIEELSRYPRISKLASEKLQLISAKKIPYVLTINKSNYENELAVLESKTVVKQFEKIKQSQKVSKAGL